MKGETGNPAGGDKYYTQEDVRLHNCAEDCWVVLFGKVLDLTPLLAENMGPLASPIIEAAGTDVSSWFNNKGEPRTCVDEETGLVIPYTPQGRFLHIPPAFPTNEWRTDFGLPWWRDPRFILGRVSSRTRIIRIVNVLTQQEDELRVASEESLSSIQERYNEFNAHGASYTWKVLRDGSDKFQELDMERTLSQNGVEDDAEELESLELLPHEADCYKPCIHIYYNDDLTAA
jgi:hypothetical protein